MKSFLFVAALIACGWSAHAQITTMLNRLPDGRDEVRIRNDSATGLVAYVVTVRQVRRSDYTSTAPFVIYGDPLIEPATQPLAAGEERAVLAKGFLLPPGRRVAAASGGRVLEGPVVAAGIFADGTTGGDAVLLTRLLLRRSSMLQAVETAMELLSEAGRHNVPRAQLIRQFRIFADSVSRWYLAPEQQAGRGVYQSIIGKLTNLPEGQLGSAFPPSDFVAEQTAALNRQRVKLVESQPSLADAALVSAR